MDWPMFNGPDLHVAHVTPRSSFIELLGVMGKRMSYRMDNLILLCEFCHSVQTDADAGGRGRLHGLGRLSKEFLAAEPHIVDTSIRQQDWYQKRLQRTHELFERVMAQRGWHCVKDLAAREGWPILPSAYRQASALRWF